MKFHGNLFSGFWAVMCKGEAHKHILQLLAVNVHKKQGKMWDN
jgi:hypothetical protein